MTKQREMASGTRAIYENAQAPVGSLVSGELLKEMVSKKFFPVSGATIDGAYVASGDIDFSEIEDNEYFAVIQNPNCGDIDFIQLFTEQKILIHTGLLSENWNR